MEAKPLWMEEDDRCQGLPLGWFAVDTETTHFTQPLFRDGTQVSPFKHGRLVLGTIAGEGRAWLYHRQELANRVKSLLHAGYHIIFHNAAYDVPVLINFDSNLKGPFVRAYRENRIHDTKVLEVLIRIAQGMAHEQLHQKTTLKDLALRYAGMDLSKNPDIRSGFGPYEKSPEGLPAEYIKYAAEDAVATYQVYKVQQPLAYRLSTQSCRYKSLPDALAKFGPLCERNHVMGDLALNWLQRHPMRVDRDKVLSAQAAINGRMRRLEALMLDWSCRMLVKRKRVAGDVMVEADVAWARRPASGKDKGVFKLKHKVIRHLLGVYAAEKDIIPERTSTGEITLERDFWSEHVPRLTLELEELASGTSFGADGHLMARLSVWMDYTRLRMMASRYLFPLASSERHYPRYFSLGARTSRTAASRPPVQQIPKRRDSLRGVFIPEEGHVFIEADYIAAELTALAQSYTLLFGDSTLGRSINEGRDCHADTAARLFPDRDPAEFRQACKAINFGLPGGMGPAKFAIFARGYGVHMSTEEAKLLRERAFRADPELRRWVQESASARERVKLAAKNLNLPLDVLIDCLKAWRRKAEGKVHWGAAHRRLVAWSKDPADSELEIPIRPGFRPKWDLWLTTSRAPGGTVRGRATFTEAHNFPFQAGVAEIGKAALFNLWAVEGVVDFQPVAYVHDSILVQCPEDLKTIELIRAFLRNAMIDALREICPDLPGAGVDVSEPQETWGSVGGVFAEALS